MKDNRKACMKKKPRARRMLATLFSALIVLPLLSGCSLIFGQGGPFGPTAAQEDSGLSSEEREALVNESRINRYVARIIDDPTSLSVFANQMPKGADVRVIPTTPDAAPSALSPEGASSADDADAGQDSDNPGGAAAEDATGLPFSEDEYRVILTQALAQRIGYLEVVAGLSPEQIQRLDSIQGQVARGLSEPASDFKVTVNFLAPVDCDQAGEGFKEALGAAIDCFEASDRVVGIILLPATTDEGRAAFFEQMDAIDLLDQSLREASAAAGEATGGTEAQAPAEPSDEAAAQAPAEPSGDEAELSSADAADEEGAEPEEPKEERLLPPLSITIDDAFIAGRGYDALLDSMTAALDRGHATRIDFGASIAYEADAYGLLRHLVEGGVGVTVAPRSVQGLNGALSSDAGTYRLFSSMGVGLAVTTGPDAMGPGDLGAAFAQLASAHALTYSDLKALSYSALDVAFLSSEQRDEQRALLDESFQVFEATISQMIDDFQLLR